MRKSITTNLKIYHRTGKDMFSIWKNVILNTFGIFGIFVIRKGPEYLYRLFNILPEQTTCEINNDFMMNVELNLCKALHKKNKVLH